MKKELFRYIAVFLILLGISCASKKALPPDQSNAFPDGKDMKSDTLLNEETIGAHLQEKSDDFNRCFDDEARRNKGFDTKRVMSVFTLTKEGKVASSGLIAVNPVSDDFKECFKRILSSMLFEPIQTDKPVLVFYPVEKGTSRSK